jgi:hypothetical protein
MALALLFRLQLRNYMPHWAPFQIGRTADVNALVKSSGGKPAHDAATRISGSRAVCGALRGT